ncbi:glycosyltransferase [Luteipulveratus flavus]|uniref:Glycosyltransferase n=1 Tax=Luteipulveratus flavus TaxID=3031728 RepID=A0ABT6CGM3_9MICO|nr:glycosyltransferase [Luteipulveratus sp. YIM 133296]MDF8266456.1 glycosyltransferase [Luteipulveratus sp. YIM 133296]
MITRPVYAASLEAALADDPETAAHLTVRYHDLPARVLRHKKRGFDLYWYYSWWQRELASVARELHVMHRFDVAHHVTFANDWLPCGVAALKDVPLVWGPVGGATAAPWRLARWLGPRAVATEVVRTTASEAFRRAFTDRVARRASLVVAQNGDVARRFRRARRTVVEPNAAFEGTEYAGGVAAEREPGLAVFVGRLIPWKGARLAIATLAEPDLHDWRLEIYGTGPLEPSLRAYAGSLGVADRVTFHGHRPRAEVLEAYRRAQVMLFPSMHDSAGWAVGEASSAGCPVVCLDIGGPPVLAGLNGHVVTPSEDVVPALARAVLDAAASGGEPHRRWASDRLPALVSGWYADALANPCPGR